MRTRTFWSVDCFEFVIIKKIVWTRTQIIRVGIPDDNALRILGPLGCGLGALSLGVLINTVVITNLIKPFSRKNKISPKIIIPLRKGATHIEAQTPRLHGLELINSCTRKINNHHGVVGHNFRVKTHTNFFIETLESFL